MVKQYKHKDINFDIPGQIKPPKYPTILFISGAKGPEKQVLSDLLIDIKKDNCPYKCKVIDDPTQSSQADAIVFHLKSLRGPRQLRFLVTNRNPHQPWIAFSYEPHVIATHDNIMYKTMGSIFNRTMYFRASSDVSIKYGFVVNKEDAAVFPKNKVINPKPYLTLDYYKQAVATSFISNCEDTSGRMKYINELKQYINIDIYGKCGNLMCGSPKVVGSDYRVDKDECLEKVSKLYYFYLAFESSFCEDYATEIIYNILYYPIVPVVFGGANYSKLLPPNSYIDATNIKPEDLADLLEDIANDEVKYMSYLRWRNYFRPSTVGSVLYTCDLCSKMHDPKFYEKKVIKNLYEWFVKDDECVDGNRYPSWKTNKPEGLILDKDTFYDYEDDQLN